MIRFKSGLLYGQEMYACYYLGLQKLSLDTSYPPDQGSISVYVKLLQLLCEVLDALLLLQSQLAHHAQMQLACFLRVFVHREPWALQLQKNIN